jgi:hypothetical protein
MCNKFFNFQTRYMFNSNDVGLGLYGVVFNGICMSLLHDYSGHMVIPKQFQGQF